MASYQFPPSSERSDRTSTESELALDVQPDVYQLRLDGRLLARLDGGAAALMPAAGKRLREIDMEVAIERAEDWLMPSSKLFQGLPLRVRDATGRIRSRLGAQSSFTTAEVEEAFTRTFDALAYAPPADRDYVADLVLLRELAHHGRLSRIFLD